MSCDVGVDVWGYTPVPLWVIKKKMALRISEFVPRSPEEIDKNVEAIRAENASLWV